MTCMSRWILRLIKFLVKWHNKISSKDLFVSFESPYVLAPKPIVSEKPKVDIETVTENIKSLIDTDMDTFLKAFRTLLNSDKYEEDKRRWRT